MSPGAARNSQVHCSSLEYTDETLDLLISFLMKVLSNKNCCKLFDDLGGTETFVKLSIICENQGMHTG